jgi:hypothetical protein
MTALAQALQHLPQLQTLDLMCALAMAQLASVGDYRCSRSSPVYEAYELRLYRRTCAAKSMSEAE